MKPPQTMMETHSVGQGEPYKVPLKGKPSDIGVMEVSLCCHEGV